MTGERPGADRRPLAVRWAWLLVLLGGVAAYLIVLRTLVATQNPLYVPSLLLLGSAVVPASVLVYAASGPGRAPVGRRGDRGGGGDRRGDRHGRGRHPGVRHPATARGRADDHGRADRGVGEAGRAGDHPDLRPTPSRPGRRGDHRDRLRDGLRHPGDDGVRVLRPAAEPVDRRPRPDAAAPRAARRRPATSPGPASRRPRCGGSPRPGAVVGRSGCSSPPSPRAWRCTRSGTVPTSGRSARPSASSASPVCCS